jgi:hypothetical protein
LKETVLVETVVRQRVSPIVEVAGNQGGQVGMLSEFGVVQQMTHLPAPLPFSQSQVPIDQVQRPGWSVNHNELCPARLSLAVPQRHVRVPPKFPARQDQVPVATFLVRAIELVQVRARVQLSRQELRLIVKSRTADVAIDFLQTDEVRLLRGNHVDDSLDPIPTITATDAFVNVVGQQSHRRGSDGWVFVTMFGHTAFESRVPD